MKDGRVLQSNIPSQLYSHPSSAWVAKFLNCGNIFDSETIKRIDPKFSGEAIIPRNAIQINENKTKTNAVRSDLALLKSFEIRLPALHEATRTAIEVYESYQRQFLTGRKSWLDVMNSARDLQQARLQLADVTAGHLTLSWRLYVLANPLQAIGG